MRGKSSSSSSKCRNGDELTIDEVKKSKGPHLSGAYIRNLVKQLTSSKTSNNVSLEGSSNQDMSENHKQGKFPSPPQKEHKKQVRRRLHTSRPYQERLQNMAEARREIVTALKFHRASMKQASENQQQQQMHLESSSLEQEAKLKSWRNPRIYASTSSTPNHLQYSPYSWPVCPIGPPPPLPPFFQENLNFQLPNQTLGLNLNLQDFSNLDTPNLHYNNNPSSIYSSFSTEEIPCTVVPPQEVVEFGDDGLHHAMDDKEMEEIRSIGEQHQLEWDDTMNMMTSSCWFKFLKAMEIGNVDQEDVDFAYSPFDEVMNFPAWLSANDQSLLQYHCSDDYLPESALPCMDIEEIEGMGVDWLA